MKVLILAAGGSPTPADSYPLLLEEFNGIPHIEHVTGKIRKISGAEIIVAARAEDLERYSLGGVLRLLDPRIQVIPIHHPCAGAACTALLASELFEDDEELLILGMNEVLEADFAMVVAEFRARELDAGVVVFPSYHPRYSYVRLDEEGNVVQAEEKHPISHTAVASFYWFRKSSDFVAAAENMIRKGAEVDGLYYICPSLNELVLWDRKIGSTAVSANNYFPLKTERQVERYETISTQTGEIGQLR